MHQYILKLQSKNFRNLNTDAYTFSRGINCIFGENGNGKTNILELIHFITNKKSFRKKTNFQQLLSIDSGVAEIQCSALFSLNEEEFFISSKIYENDQQWYLNNQIVKKNDKFFSLFINPFDSFQFHNNAAFRRQLFDYLASALFPEYKKILNKYLKVLRTRNNILVSSQDIKLINAYQQQFNQYSYELTYFRKEFLTQLNEFIAPTFNKIFSVQHKLELNLDSKLKDLTSDQVEHFFELQQNKDMQRRITTYGIHKDDYLFHFDGLLSYEYSSLGQQKMSFLSLIFAYIELFRYKFNTYPIILIDDVSGELDALRWRKLINFLQTKNFQVFITTANDAFRCELEKINESKKFYIDDGKIIYQEV
jgi:DNA replication and repair protein RecF